MLTFIIRILEVLVSLTFRISDYLHKLLSNFKSNLLNFPENKNGLFFSSISLFKRKVEKEKQLIEYLLQTFNFTTSISHLDLVFQKKRTHKLLETSGHVYSHLSISQV